MALFGIQKVHLGKISLRSLCRETSWAGYGSYPPHNGGRRRGSPTFPPTAPPRSGSTDRLRRGGVDLFATKRATYLQKRGGPFRDTKGPPPSRSFLAAFQDLKFFGTPPHVESTKKQFHFPGRGSSAVGVKNRFQIMLGEGGGPFCCKKGHLFEKQYSCFCHAAGARLVGPRIGGPFWDTKGPPWENLPPQPLP